MWQQYHEVLKVEEWKCGLMQLLGEDCDIFLIRRHLEVKVLMKLAKPSAGDFQCRAIS